MSSRPTGRSPVDRAAEDPRYDEYDESVHERDSREHMTARDAASDYEEQTGRRPGTMGVARDRTADEPSRSHAEARQPRLGRRTSDKVKPLSEPDSIGELISQLAEQSSTLVQKEIELAKAEMAQKGKAIGVGAGMMGAGTYLAHLALLALTAALILALATFFEAWIAALVVGVAFAVIAAVLVIMGRKRAQRGMPPVPEQTIESVKEDAAWIARQK